MTSSRLPAGGPRLSAGGAVATALGAGLSWICCLPLILGGLGAGSAAFATATAPARPYLMLVSFGLLGLAFFQVYRPAIGDCASPRRQLLVWLAAGLIALLATVPYWLNWVIYWSL